MIVDVNVLQSDEAFLDDLDEIMEDTMIQMFILRSRNEVELEKAKECANIHTQIFYYAPLSLSKMVDSNCIGFLLKDANDINENIQKPLFIEDSDITQEMIEALIKSNTKGIILNATKPYLELKNFFISIGSSNFEKFESGVIGKLSMQKIVLQSSYPEFSFDTIFSTAKKISDEMFRPDGSIIAEATKNSLILFGFKK